MTRIRDLCAVLTLLLIFSVTASAGTITGSKTTNSGTVTESSAGTITGSKAGTITGSKTDTISGSKTGTITGSLAIDPSVSYLLGIVAYVW
jgi:hypothetical protein